MPAMMAAGVASPNAQGKQSRAPPPRAWVPCQTRLRTNNWQKSQQSDGNHHRHKNPRDFICDTGDVGFTALRVVERLYHIAKPCLATFGGDLVFKAAVFYHGTCQHRAANMFRQGTDSPVKWLSSHQPSPAVTMPSVAMRDLL